MHAMLLQCIWRTYRIILCICGKTTAKNKSNFWLRELAQLQLRILTTIYCDKNDFEFSRYSGYILQARWTKAKVLTSNFFQISRTRMYSNRYIFDCVIQEITGWHFFRCGVDKYFTEWHRDKSNIYSLHEQISGIHNQTSPDFLYMLPMTSQLGHTSVELQYVTYFHHISAHTYIGTWLWTG